MGIDSQREIPEKASRRVLNVRRLASNAVDRRPSDNITRPSASKDMTAGSGADIGSVTM